MKRMILGLIICVGATSYAALISRTYTYTSGNTMSANENNTNENTLYTEFNGNVESVNIKDATIVNADIADTTIDYAKFAATVQSTFTYVATLGAYRRPVLSFISVTTVDVESNTGTANQTCIQFPNERRCVTENTSSTSVNRRFIITETASTSGTKNSGLRATYVETASTWYAIYAVKTTDVATDFVLIGDTVTPTQGNFAALNTIYGTNGWVYLGMIRNGNGAGGATTDIVSFVQIGNETYFVAVAASGSGVVGSGILFADTGGATSLTYTTTAGTGTTDLPSHFGIITWMAGANSGSGTTQLRNSASSVIYLVTDGTAAAYLQIRMPNTVGIRVSNSSSVAMDITLTAFTDTVLGIGFNPQI